jgi:hypothetical protein
MAASSTNVRPGPTLASQLLQRRMLGGNRTPLARLTPSSIGNLINQSSKSPDDKNKGIHPDRIKIITNSDFKEPPIDWKNLAKDISELKDLMSSLPPLGMSQHGRSVDFDAVEFGSFKTISAEEREIKCRVTIQDGKLMLGDKPLSTGLGNMNYVFLTTGELYAAKPIPGSVYHSSLVQGGESVAAAGQIKTTFDGKLIKIDERSGHLAPYNRVGYLAAWLSLHGVDVQDNHVEVSALPIINEKNRTPSSVEKMEKLKNILSKKGGNSSPDLSSMNLTSTNRRPKEKASRFASFCSSDFSPSADEAKINTNFHKNDDS